MQAPDAPPGSRAKRRGKKTNAISFQEDGEQFVTMPLGGNMVTRTGRGCGISRTMPRSSKDTIHHHPPKEIASEVGYPVRGGQTLLIAYFPWEATEADIEREFSRFCRVKRVHLVADKSTRKPRCFGFVKFVSKVDAEEALQATAQGLVQLPDTRGHVWHLKAEWTKSGDMVVDDSETEQEVAKRKEERQSRSEQKGPSPSLAIMDGFDPMPPQPKSGKWAASILQGELHPGVPAPLPPLQTRPPAPQASLGLQVQMPVMHTGHNHPGVAGGLGAQAPHPPQHGQVHQLAPAQHSHPQNQGVSQQLFHGQPSHHMYGGTVSNPSVYSSLGGGVTQQLSQESSLPVQPLGQGLEALLQDAAGFTGTAQSVLRDQLGNPQSYTSAPHAYTASHQHYATAQEGYTPPAQSYVAQPQGYVTGQQGHQGCIASQQGYAAGHHTYAPQQSAFGPQAQAFASHQQGYTPQAYAGYSVGQSLPHQGAFGYLQQPGAAAASSGVITYGGYPAPGSQSQVMTHPGDDLGQESATVTIAGMPHVVVSPPVQPSFLHNAQLSPSPALTSPAGGLLASSHRSTGDAAPVLPSTDAGLQSAAAADAPYLDMVWHHSELERAAAAALQQLPAPPSQQPPAPPSRRSAWEAMQHAAGLPGSSVSPGAWNSFDDAAAKGLVDGLVGHEDVASSLVAAWSARAA